MKEIKIQLNNVMAIKQSKIATESVTDKMITQERSHMNTSSVMQLYNQNADLVFQNNMLKQQLLRMENHHKYNTKMLSKQSSNKVNKNHKINTHKSHSQVESIKAKSE